MVALISQATKNLESIFAKCAMKENNTAAGCCSLASVLIAMALVASCERESGGHSGNTNDPHSVRTAPSHQRVNSKSATPPSKDLPLRVADLARRTAGGNLFLQDEVSKLVADYAEDSGLSPGECCLRLLDEAGEDLQPGERETLLTLLARALIGNYKEETVLALGLPAGMPRTELIIGLLTSRRSELTVDEIKALHDGLGPGRDRKSSAVSLALTTMDRDGLAAAAELASELELQDEREAALAGLAHDFVLQGLDRESEEHRAGYERLMELAKAEGESTYELVRHPFFSVPVESISPEELKELKKSLNIPK